MGVCEVVGSVDGRLDHSLVHNRDVAGECGEQDPVFGRFATGRSWSACRVTLRT
jgi:hypothetical protein